MSPTYICSEWIHDHEDEPFLFYSELDDERYEVRKIEMFKDGRSIRVSEERPQSGATGLGIVPVPTVEEINAIVATEAERFRAWEITAQEFEGAWRAAIGNG